MKGILICILLFLAIFLGFIGGIGYCGYQGAWIPAIGIIALGYLAYDKAVALFKEMME